MAASGFKKVLVTGANGYVGNAVARAFVGAGWLTYGLVRSQSAASMLEQEEITPVIGTIDNVESHEDIKKQLPPTLDAIISTTEDFTNYIPHYEHAVKLLRTISLSSAANGVRTLVIFTSGCKDYGIGPHYHGAADLAPHTEESPVNAPDFVADRARTAVKIFDHKDAFAPVLVRPTNIYGRSSSYYRVFFDVAATAAAADQPLLMTSAGNTITHALHLDDCGEAYVALAEHPRREEVEGEIFNMSSRRYETLDELAQALAAEFQISKGVKYVDAADLKGPAPWPKNFTDFPQWVGSEKIRRVTGWNDHRPLFTEAMHVYRMAHDAAQAAGNENIKKVKAVTKLMFASSQA